MALTDVSRPTDVAMLTDLYELTMAQGLWENDKLEERDCFTAFYRDKPFGSAYAVMCGTSDLPDLVENLRFTDEDIDYLASLFAPAGGRMFNPAFLEYLRGFRAHVDIDAVAEGDLVFPREPMVRVTGPALECQLLETALLNTIGFQTLAATKTARVVAAAKGRPVAEFGLRRAQGPDGALSAARAAYVGGCASTSNVLAAKRYSIPASGTHAHAWVMAFPDELSAFRAYAEASPKNCTLLIDTYDVMRGVENAIIVAHEMEGRGERLAGVRIDSGDLCALSQRARARLDEAGLPYVKVIVSNDLDEHLVESLLLQGARVDGFGIGTKLVTCFDQPALSGVYKLSAKRMPGQDWIPVIKVSEQVYKRTIPGVQDLRRYFDESGAPVADMICTVDYPHGVPATIVDVNDPLLTRSLDGLRCESMLHRFTQDGQRVAQPEDLSCARSRAAANLASLKPASKRLLNPQVYPVGIEAGLSELRQSMIAQARSTQNDLTWR